MPTSKIIITSLDLWAVRYNNTDHKNKCRIFTDMIKAVRFFRTFEAGTVSLWKLQEHGWESIAWVPIPGEAHQSPEQWQRCKTQPTHQHAE